MNTKNNRYAGLLKKNKKRPSGIHNWVIYFWERKLANLKVRRQQHLVASLLLFFTLFLSAPANAFVGIIYDWAITRINEAWPPVNVSDQRREAIDHSTVGLMNIDKPTASIVLSKKEITPLIINAIEIANVGLPATVTNVGIGFSEQSIQFGGDFSGYWKEKGVQASGTVSGDVTFSFDGKELLLSPSFRSVKVDTLEVDGWWWLPQKIALLVSPLLEAFIENINGQIEPESINILSELTKEPEIINLNDRTIVIPKLEVRAASLLVNREHLSVILEFGSDLNLKTSEAEVHLDYTEFEKRFLEKAGALITSPPASGIIFSQDFISSIFGELNFFETEQERQQLTILKTIENLKELKGPDFVLRISALKVDQLILEQLKKTVQELDEPNVVIRSLKHRFNYGTLELIAEIEENFKIAEGKTGTALLDAAIQVGTYIENDGKTLKLLPTVSGLSINSLSLNDGSVDFSRVTVSINALLERLRKSINRILPEIPIAIPAVLPQKHELAPIEFAGGKASFSPQFFTQPQYELEGGIFYFSEQGLWILADIGISELQDREVASVVTIPKKFTSLELDKAIQEMIEMKIGGLSNEDIYAFSSWKRFAELFNYTWQRLSPKVLLSLDSGNQRMDNQQIDLLEYSRLSCQRTRSCDRDPCRQSSCEFNSCSRSCRGNEFERIACKARNLKCDIEANARKADCDVRAVAAKANCDAREELSVLDCNRLAEQEVLVCQASRLFQNFFAEISGVGNIGGEARLRGDLTIDASHLSFDPDQHEIAFAPKISGNLRADIGLDWIPYDLLGHAFCPTRGRVNANSSATFNNAQPWINATLLKEGQAKDDGDPDTVDLGIKFNKTRFPVSISPGLLHSLYQNNPQLLVTCPLPSALIVPALAFSGTNKAIGENDIARAIASISNTGFIAYSAFEDEEPEKMGALFGGSFYIDIEERTQPLPIKKTTTSLPGGEVTFVPSLHEKGFLLKATINQNAD